MKTNGGQSPPYGMTANEPVWDDLRLANLHEQSDKSVRVQRMFDAIAPTYERVNRLFSMGIDASWRRRVVALAACRSSDLVLDVCTGTGDLARAFVESAAPPTRVIGVDFAAGMLQNAVMRSRQTLHYVQGDGLRLPLPAGACDVITCAFGVRNFQDLSRGLAEFRRVLRPAGRAIILEFSRPSSRWIRWGFELYSGRIMPALATWVSGDRTGAYRYLPRSVISFPDVQAMCKRLTEAGFATVETHALTHGVATIYLARVDQHG